MGTVVSGRWYVMTGLDTKTDKPIGAVYVFDPASNAWTTRRSMPVPAHHIMTAALGGEDLRIRWFCESSGRSSVEADSPRECLRPCNRRMARLGADANARGAGWAVEPDRSVSSGTPQLVLSTVEEYDPTTNRWRSRSPMPTARNHLLAAAVNGRIYAIGGRLGSAQIRVADDTNIVEEYDPRSRPVERQGPCADSQ